MTINTTNKIRINVTITHIIIINIYDDITTTHYKNSSIYYTNILTTNISNTNITNTNVTINNITITHITTRNITKRK